MITISADEFKKKYGEVGFSQFPQPQSSPGFFSKNAPGLVQAGNEIKGAFNSGIDYTKEGFADAKKAGLNPVKQFESTFKVGSGLVNAAASPLAPVLNPINKDVINPIGNKIGSNPGVQKFANSKAGQITSRVAEDVGNVANVTGAILGASEGGPKVKAGISEGLENTATKFGETTSRMGEKFGGVGEAARNFKNDIVPNSDRIINHQVTQALDLTPGDLNNIYQSTGNEVGRWIADKNAIGTNKELTVKNVKNIFDENYQGVRNEIGKVQTTYKPSQVPRYVESLKAIQKKVDNVPGLQQVSVEVENLLNKKEINLDDVQRVKELIDDHFNLYKQTGDVGEGAAKAGLDTIRKDLKTFIEDEVKKNTGADIRGMNNDVATAKSIMDAVEARNPRGLTRSNFKLGDLAAFGFGTSFAGPLGGIAALFFKKLYDSPAIKLRFSQWLDSISDAQKLKMGETLKTGQLPSEFKQFIKTKNGSKGYEGPGAMNKDFSGQTLKPEDLVSHEGAPDMNQVNSYRSQLHRGEKLEPLKVIKQADGKYGIEDGKHRFEAYRWEGVKDIPVEITKRPIKVNNYQNKPQYTKGSNGRFTGSS